MTAVTIQIKGLDALRRQLESFSDRRFGAAVATAMTRTAAAVSQEWRQILNQELDRPTPMIGRSVRVERAEAARLSAGVRINDNPLNGGLSAAQILAPHGFGGDRMVKRFEAALQAQGAMPSGMRAVPGPAARLDSYGNVARQQIVQVLNQLGGQLSPGYQRVISKSAARRLAAAKRAGREFVALPRGHGRLRAGIYERRERGLAAVFYFVSRTQYPRRLSLVEAGRVFVAQRLPVEMKRAVDEHIARLAARGTGR